LQDLGTSTGQATLTIESLEDQLGCFGDVSGFGSGPRSAVQLNLLLGKPLSIVARRRITGWGCHRSLLRRHHQGAGGRHCAETKVSFKTVLQTGRR